MSGEDPREPSPAGDIERASHRHPATLGSRGATPRRRWRWVSLSLLAVMIGGLSALLSFGLRRDPSAIRSVLLNESAPQFTLRVLDGNSVIRLTDFRGRPVVVNFWASWCADCRLEHPNLVAAWRRFGPRGVVFVNVVFEDSLANASRFIRQLGSDGIQVLDPAGRTAIEYGVYGIPETFFIDGRGVILDKKIGPSTYPFLVAEIEHLMGREAARGG